MGIPDLSSLAVLLSPVVAAPLVRWMANTFAFRFGGPPGWWGLGLAVFIELGLSVVLASPAVTPETVARGVIYSLFTFVGAFGVNEYLSTKSAMGEDASVRGVQHAPARGSWMR